MNKEFFEALEGIERANGISQDILIERIKQGILKAIKRDYPNTENVRIDIDPDTQNFGMCLLKTVVEGEPLDPANEITLDEAKTYDAKAVVGGTCEIPLSPARFGRVAASSAKQSIRSDIKQFERDRLVAQYKDKEHELVSATVLKVEPATVFHGQLQSSCRRSDAGFSAPYVFMFAERYQASEPLLGIFEILSYYMLIFAMYQNTFGFFTEYSGQRSVIVYQHVSGR